MFPKLFHKPMRQEIFVLVICASAFLVNLLLVTEVRYQIQSSETRSYLQPHVGFHPILSSSGRSLHLPVHWLLHLGQNLWECFCHLWMFGSGLGVWWDWLQHGSTYFFNSSREQCLHFYILTSNRGRSRQHHHPGHDRKQTISFLQTLLEIYHSSHITGKIQATVARK